MTEKLESRACYVTFESLCEEDKSGTNHIIVYIKYFLVKNNNQYS